MSDVSQGAGWWLASDGRWYPPESPESPESPAAPAPAPPPPVLDPSAPRRLRGVRTPTVPVPSAAPAPAPAPPPPAVPAGWGARDPSLVYSAPQLAELHDVRPDRPGARREARRGPGNVVLSLLCVVLAGAVLGLCFGHWYQVRVLPASASRRAPAALVAQGRLLGPAYGGWRIVVPVLAGLVVALGLAATAVWRRARFPRSALWPLRFLGLLLVAAVILTLTQRVSSFGPVLTAKRQFLEASGVQFHYTPTGGAWAALVCAVLSLGASMWIASRIR